MTTNTPSMEPVGYSNLIKRYNLKVLPHYCSTYIGSRASSKLDTQKIVVLPKSYALKQPLNPLLQLEFAIKHEGINLEIISCCFLHITPSALTEFIKQTPSGKYRRIIWFLYEFLTGNRLELEDIKKTPYVDLLDRAKYYVASSIKSMRHAVNNNLLGNKEFCPIVRKTPLLKEFELKELAKEMQKLVSTIEPQVLARAVNSLYIGETRVSLDIEKSNKNMKRAQQLLSMLEEIDTITGFNKTLLLTLQNKLADKNSQETDYRHTQNFVSERKSSTSLEIYHITPKPEDISSLMQGLIDCEGRLFTSPIDPVIKATIIAFGFVLLHPFEDGNGRIHRFLTHYILSKNKFFPDGIVFPISATMLANKKHHIEMMHQFSKLLLQAVDTYEFNDQGVLSCSKETKVHFQFIDYTHFAEYLFSCIEASIRHDTQEELEFITNYDEVKTIIRAIADIPDNRIDLIIRFISQNNGELGENLRGAYFNDITKKQVKDIEKVLQQKLFKQ